jgi:bis(5'-nucleosidyl)-tetraphosphatase
MKMSKINSVSAGIVPVKVIDGKYKFLLLRAYTNWDFPKGKLEANEDAFDAALRETEEETTLSKEDLNFRWGRISKKSDPYKRGTKFAIYFIAEPNKTEIELPISPELGKPEHNEYKWVDYKEAEQLVNKRIKKILDWANEIINK